MKTVRPSRGGVPSAPPRREFRQARAHATHQKLLAAAARLFSEHGFRRTQAPDIAHEAGLSTGAFYRYFEDKRDVLIELMQLFLARQNELQAAFLEAWRQRLVSKQADGRDFVDALLELATRQYDVNADLVRTYVALSYEDERVGALRRTWDEADRRDLARFLGAVTSRERVPSPLAAARLLDLAAEEVFRWASLEGGRPAREVRAALGEMIYRYLFA